MKNYGSKIPDNININDPTGCSVFDNAANYIHKKTQAPMEGIKLTLMSISASSAQGIYDFYLPWGDKATLSVFAGWVGGTGTRKTAVIKAASSSLVRFENEQNEKNRIRKSEYKVNKKLLQKIARKIENEIISCMNNGINYDDLKDGLIDVHESIDSKYQDVSFLLSNPTPKAVDLTISKGIKSAIIVNGEASNFIGNARPIKATAKWNDNWSGACASSENPTDGKIDTSNSSLSILLALQDTEFDRIIFKYGDILLGNGFVQRCLICSSINNIGYRNDQDAKIDPEEIKAYDDRIYSLLLKNLPNLNRIIPKKTTLYFSKEAEEYHIDFSRELEFEFRPGGRFHKEATLLNKVAENAAKISAVLHVIQYGSGEVSLETLKAAINLCMYYAYESIRIFIKKPQVEIDAEELYSELSRRFTKNSFRYVSIRTFRGCISEALRKPGRFSAAILRLHDNHIIQKLEHRTGEYVDLYPGMPDDNMRFMYEVGWLINPEVARQFVSKLPTIERLRQINELLGMPYPIPAQHMIGGPFAVAPQNTCSSF